MQPSSRSTQPPVGVLDAAQGCVDKTRRALVGSSLASLGALSAAVAATGCGGGDAVAADGQQTALSPAPTPAIAAAPRPVPLPSRPPPAKPAAAPIPGAAPAPAPAPLSPTAAPAPKPAPPPPPPPPPPTAKLVEAKPNAINPSKTFGGPSDWVDITKLPPPIPWKLFTDDKLTIARSMEGVSASAYRSLHVYGNMNALYIGTPRLMADETIFSYTPQIGNDPVGIVRRQKTFPGVSGPRGIGLMDPYTTWHGHTRRLEDGSLNTDLRTPWWVGVMMDGTMSFAMRDGSVTYPFKLPVTTYCNDFTYYEPRHLKLFFAVDTGAGTVIKIDRNTNPPTCSTFATDLGTATSIRAIGRKLYVADNKRGAVWEIDGLNAARRKVCDLPFAFWLDYTSRGQLLAMQLDRTVRLIDVHTGSVSDTILPLNLTALGRKANDWVTVSVDRNGTFGPVDTFIAIASTGARNIDFWRYNLLGQVQPISNQGGGRMTSGNTAYTSDSTGHYPWVAEHHPDDGCILVQGFANLQPTVIAAVHPSDTWPAPAGYNHALATLGQGQLSAPGVSALTGGQAPSFSALMTPMGWSLLGCTADHIAEMSFADAAAFVRKGMIGSVPRIISAADMRGLLYYCYYNSQRHIREGAALINSLLAAKLD